MTELAGLPSTADLPCSPDPLATDSAKLALLERVARDYTARYEALCFGARVLRGQDMSILREYIEAQRN